MRIRIREMTWSHRQVWTIALMVASSAAVLVVHGTPIAHADEPPGNCWNDSLAADPLHCYALEKAQKDGIIVVEGVYEAGTELHIYFRYLRDDVTRDELHDILKSNAREFMIRFPSLVAYDDFERHRCNGSDPAEIFRDCMLDYTFDHASFYPWSSGYDNIHLGSGGAASRLSNGGWASWRELWPRQTAVSSEEPMPIDVSGVDVVNFPDVECVGRYSTASCTMWSRHPELGIAGWYDYDNSSFVQIKAPAGEEGNLEAARRELLGKYKDYEDDELITIAVKFDYKELWQWQLILNRFARSPGNTIGIEGADVGKNQNWYEQAVFLNGLVEAAYDDHGDYRETVHVWALDAERVVKALPTLLPLLGIPVDAVGVVGQYDSNPVPLVHPQPVGVDTSMSSLADNDGSGQQASMLAADSKLPSSGEGGVPREVSYNVGVDLEQPPRPISVANFSIETVAGAAAGLMIVAFLVFWVVRLRRSRA